MDGDSGDVGNDELTCVRSDKSECMYCITSVTVCLCVNTFFKNFECTKRGSLIYYHTACLSHEYLSNV